MQGNEFINEDWYRGYLKLSQLNCPKFQNFALTCPSMEDLCQSLEQLPDGAETFMGEFFRWSHISCVTVIGISPGLISQWMAFLHTQEGAFSTKLFLFLFLGNNNHFEYKGLFQNYTYSNETSAQKSENTLCSHFLYCLFLQLWKTDLF